MVGIVVPSQSDIPSDETMMRAALELASSIAGTTSPNPWVGAVLIDRDGEVFEGFTEPPPGRHAEIVVLDAVKNAGKSAEGSTLYVTLEPCSHYGRTPPCVNSIIEAGVKRVVVAIQDPDPKVNGSGIKKLEDVGIEVEVGLLANEVEESLMPYIKHRVAGVPWVTLKLAISADGRIAAPDGSSQWITGEVAREDVHLMRSRSDVIITGAGTVRADDPQLTAREGGDQLARQPLRIVLGKIPQGARVLPALEYDGDVADLLRGLAEEGYMSVLVEGGSVVAHEFHDAGMVDRYVFYMAPVLFGGDDARAMFSGPGVQDMNSLWRGRFVEMTPMGDDIKVSIEPKERAWWH